MLVKSIFRKCKFFLIQKKTILLKILIQVWGGFGIVFIAIYTAKLAAFMVEIAETQTATNVHEIVVCINKIFVKIISIKISG